VGLGAVVVVEAAQGIEVGDFQCLRRS